MEWGVLVVEGLCGWVDTGRRLPPRCRLLCCLSYCFRSTCPSAAHMLLLLLRSTYLFASVSWSQICSTCVCACSSICVCAANLSEPGGCEHRFEAGTVLTRQFRRHPLADQPLPPPHSLQTMGPVRRDRSCCCRRRLAGVVWCWRGVWCCSSGAHHWRSSVAERQKTYSAVQLLPQLPCQLFELRIMRSCCCCRGHGCDVEWGSLVGLSRGRCVLC